MKTMTILRTTLYGILLFLLSVPQVIADECVTLQPGPEAPDARGTVVIRDLGADQKEVDIMAHGLRSEEVYTVWLVTERLLGRMDMEGLGEPDYDFQTDAQGSGRYSATISEADLQEWESIKIAFHPDRNPQNMDNIIIDLEGGL